MHRVAFADFNPVGIPGERVTSTYSNVVDPAGEAAMIRTLGRAGYEQWKRKYGLQVTGNH